MSNNLDSNQPSEYVRIDPENNADHNESLNSSISSLKQKVQSFDIEDKNVEIKLDNISFWAASVNMIKISLPSMVTLILELSILLVNFAVIGHVANAEEVAGIGLGFISIHVTCFSISFGFNGALDTLVSQAFGDKEYYLCGCYLNRARIIQTIIFIPQMILLYNFKTILLAIGQDPAAVEQCQIYLNIILPGIYFIIQFETTRRYLQAMGVFNVSMYIMVFTSLFHIIMCYTLVIKYDLSVTGCAISTCITYILDFVLVALYVTFVKDAVRPESWHFFNKDSFIDLPEIVRFGIPSALMCCMEWWSYELLGIFAGWLSVKEQATFMILINILATAFMLPLGMSFAVNSLVGNSLGEGCPNRAKKYFIVSSVFTMVLSLIMMSGVSLFPNQIALFYTTDSDLHNYIAAILPIFSLTMFFDQWQGVLSGSMKGCGFQEIGTVITLISFSGIMVVSSYIFTFIFKMRIYGIILSIPCGALSATIGYMIVLLRTNWHKLSKTCIARIEDDKKHTQNN